MAGAEVGAAQVNGIWKWIAAILIAILIAGAPGMVQAVKAPSQEEVDILRERQVQVLIRLAAIDAQLQSNGVLLAQLQQQLREHESQTSDPS